MAGGMSGSRCRRSAGRRTPGAAAVAVRACSVERPRATTEIFGRRCGHAVGVGLERSGGSSGARRRPRAATRAPQLHPLSHARPPAPVALGVAGRRTRDGRHRPQHRGGARGHPEGTPRRARRGAGGGPDPPVSLGQPARPPGPECHRRRHPRGRRSGVGRSCSRTGVVAPLGSAASCSPEGADRSGAAGRGHARRGRTLRGRGSARLAAVARPTAPSQPRARPPSPNRSQEPPSFPPQSTSPADHPGNASRRSLHTDHEEPGDGGRLNSVIRDPSSFRRAPRGSGRHTPDGAPPRSGPIDHRLL